GVGAGGEVHGINIAQTAAAGVAVEQQVGQRQRGEVGRNDAGVGAGDAQVADGDATGEDPDAVAAGRVDDHVRRVACRALEHLTGLVRRDVFGVGSGLDVDGEADACRVDAALDAGVGRADTRRGHVDVARHPGHQAVGRVIEGVDDLVLDAEVVGFV